jgi:hypothetical protein
MMLFVGTLLDVSLFFYILHIRIIEPRIYSISFTNKELPLTIIQRNVLTLTFALLGVIFLVMITITPVNLSAGRNGVERIVLKVFSKNNGDRQQGIRSFKAAGRLIHVLRGLVKYHSDPVELFQIRKIHSDPEESFQTGKI